MPHTEPITYIDRQPVVSIDNEGVSWVVASGQHTWHRRTTRSVWRTFLETNLRKLNEYELAERADRGRVVPMERRG